MIVHRAFAQQPAALARRVADVQDEVADRVIVELARLVLAGIGGQFQLPFADRARVLKWQVAFIMQVCFEEPAVILAELVTMDCRLPK